MPTCVEIIFRTPHAIDATSSPQLHLLDGVEILRRRRDVVPVAASARWRGGSRDNLTHWLISTQALRDAAKAPKGTTTEARSPVKRRNTAPAFSREQCRRDRAMMSSSFRRRMTWQQSLCVAPVIQLPASERLAK